MILFRVENNFPLNTIARSDEISSKEYGKRQLTYFFLSNINTKRREIRNLFENL